MVNEQTERVQKSPTPSGVSMVLGETPLTLLPLSLSKLNETFFADMNVADVSRPAPEYLVKYPTGHGVGPIYKSKDGAWCIRMLMGSYFPVLDAQGAVLPTVKAVYLLT
jgi:hypothetical protein